MTVQLRIYDIRRKPTFFAGFGRVFLYGKLDKFGDLRLIVINRAAIAPVDDVLAQGRAIAIREHAYRFVSSKYRNDLASVADCADQHRLPEGDWQTSDARRAVIPVTGRFRLRRQGL